jgi:hypothetical protein
MAYVKKNIVTEGLSGKLGSTLVFRQRGGKTIAAVAPEKKKRELSDAQKDHQLKFRAATKYAKTAIQDDNVKVAYEQRAKDGQTAFNVAMADYMNLPSISELGLDAYTGAKGQPVVIKATDDHMVAEVQVSIYDQNGALVEEGEAQLAENGLDWVYTTQKANSQPSGSKLVARASDLPGNATVTEAVVS